MQRLSFSVCDALRLNFENTNVMTMITSMSTTVLAVAMVSFVVLVGFSHHQTLNSHLLLPYCTMTLATLRI